MNVRFWIAAGMAFAATIAPARTWTSASGNTVEAEFKALQGVMVILESADGKRLMIPLSQLSAEDQQFVREQAGPKPPAIPSLPPRHTREPHSSRTAPVPSSTPAVLTSPASAKKDSKEGKGTPLTEAEIAAFKREITDERSGDKYEFVGGMTVKKFLGDKEPNWKEGDPIPLIITCELVRVRTKKDGTAERKRETGTAEFYVVDEAGTVLFRKKERLDALEPEPDKGYKDELPKPGKYTLVIWTDFKGTRLGMTETAQVRPPVRR